jgi:hypothetical protein
MCWEHAADRHLYDSSAAEQRPCQQEITLGPSLPVGSLTVHEAAHDPG